MTLLSKMSERKTSDGVIRKRDPHSKHELFATNKQSSSALQTNNTRFQAGSINYKEIEFIFQKCV